MARHARIADDGDHEGRPDASGRPGSRPWVRRLLLGLAVVAMLVAAKVLGLGDRMGELRTWILGLGAWGPVVFVAVYAVAVVAAIPGSLLTIAAGAMFGSVLGVVVVSVASTLGAAMAFAVARWFARDSVTRWLSDNDRFTKLDRVLTAELGVAQAVGVRAEVGGNPRDTSEGTEEGRGMTVAECRQVLAEAEWQVLNGPSAFYGRVSTDR